MPLNVMQLARSALMDGEDAVALRDRDLLMDYEDAANASSFWLLFGAYLVFFMQLGFALLEAGSVRAKNTKNILLKNVLDACLGALIWWSIGYPLALGSGKENNFIGAGDFFTYKRGAGTGFYALWMFQWAFAATAATIVSGAVAERCRFIAYLTYTVVLTGFIYPVVVHWGWSDGGWLSAWDYDYVLDEEGEAAGTFLNPEMGGQGLIDFAGSGIVHMVGGGAALMGAIFLGPRLGRFDADGKPVDIQGHSTVLAVMGTFILWFGWYGFNPCSTLMWGAMQLAEKVAANTTLAAAAGGATSFLLARMSTGVLDLPPALNGILGGLVSITGPCAVVEPYAAVIIGVIGGFVYFGSHNLLLKLKIDDPLDASPVHFFCGAWGVIASGLFATKEGVVLGAFANDQYYGAFYGDDGTQLGIQFAGMAAIALWTCITSGVMFFVLKSMGILRVPPEDELAGLDESHHGGSAYDMGEAPAKA